MSNKSKNYIVDFRTTNNDVENVFNAMKACQQLGIADKKSKIEFNGVKVPAGYLDNFEQFIGAYEGIVNGTFDNIIDAMASGLDRFEATAFLYSCYVEKRKVNQQLIIDVDKLVDEYVVRKNSIEVQKVKK